MFDIRPELARAGDDPNPMFAIILLAFMFDIGPELARAGEGAYAAAAAEAGR